MSRSAGGEILHADPLLAMSHATAGGRIAPPFLGADVAVDGGATHAERSGGRCDILTVRFIGLDYAGVNEAVELGEGGLRIDLQIGRSELLVVGEERGPAEDVQELADVARPGVAVHELEGGVTQAAWRVFAVEEVVYESMQVLGSLAQRWHAHRDDA